MVRAKKKGVKERVSSKSHKINCPNCNKPILDNVKFCDHCGYNAKISSQKRTRVHKCPNCKGVINQYSRFCNHCGADIHVLSHSHAVKSLMYLILIIVIALAIFLFFGPIYIGDDTSSNEELSLIDNQFVTIGDTNCEWSGSNYRVCQTVDWEGNIGDYVKCSFQDGNDVEQSGNYVDSPFTCCSDVSSKGGIKISRVYLYNKAHTLVLDDSASVSCDGKPSAPFITPKKKEVSIESENFWFIAERTTSHGKGVGRELVVFDGDVESCEFSGRYYINGRKLEQQTGYCNGAKGIFVGSASAQHQEVITDPDNFAWGGLSKPKVNPLPETYDGYSFYAFTCDAKFFNDPSYKVNIQITGFGTNTLEFNWNYRNEETQPRVEVYYELACKILV